MRRMNGDDSCAQTVLWKRSTSCISWPLLSLFPEPGVGSVARHHVLDLREQSTRQSWQNDGSGRCNRRLFSLLVYLSAWLSRCYYSVSCKQETANKRDRILKCCCKGARSVKPTVRQQRMWNRISLHVMIVPLSDVSLLISLLSDVTQLHHNNIRQQKSCFSDPLSTNRPLLEFFRIKINK